jgi:acetyl esterase/lipase
MGKISLDEVYSEEHDLRWDIYFPDRVDPAPVALLLFGGGWKSGSRKMMAEYAQVMAAQGYVAIAPDYRLLDNHAWPAPVEDVQKAIASVKSKASQLNADVSQLFLVGYSAGAQLAFMAAAGSPGQVQGIAAFFPPTELGEHYSGILGVAVDKLAAISPINHVGSLPPTILFAGDKDILVSAEETIRFHSAMRSAGRPADLRIYADLIHDFGGLPGIAEITLADAAAFFKRTHSDRERFAGALTELQLLWNRILGIPDAQ